MVSFDTKKYWETRLSKDYSLHGVGRLNWGLHYNKWLYRVRRAVFRRLMRSLQRDTADADVLDIGSGTGFYINRWKELGVNSITGIDLTEVAVRRLSQQFPADTFLQMNIGQSSEALAGRSFDFISCMDVMFHIVDDCEYEAAVGNVFSLLKDGGYFIFSDLFLHGETRRASYIVHRNISMVEDLCRNAGFELVDRVPMFVLMNEPLDTSNRFLRLYWAVLTRIVTRVRVLGLVIGAALYPIERILISRLRESPATEILICRKPPAGED
ncbi:MAG: class I SAM-dependent methyltransferase [Candidatus Latescibacterota bacterium]